jgi:hypothetical protein
LLEFDTIVTEIKAEKVLKVAQVFFNNFNDVLAVEFRPYSFMWQLYPTRQED